MSTFTRPLCELCDTHGPDFGPTMETARIDLHRALHHAWWELTKPLAALLERLTLGSR